MRGADDIVRFGLRAGAEKPTSTKAPTSSSWYDEVEGLRPTVGPWAYRAVRSLRAGGPDAERLKIKGECECCGEVRWDPYFAGLVLVGDGMSSRHRRGVFFV